MLPEISEQDRKLKQDTFIRVCKDSGWHMDYIQAAILAAKVLGCHPLEVWIAFSSFDQMEQIAKGTQSACNSIVI